MYLTKHYIIVEVHLSSTIYLLPFNHSEYIFILMEQTGGHTFHIPVLKIQDSKQSMWQLSKIAILLEQGHRILEVLSLIQMKMHLAMNAFKPCTCQCLIKTLELIKLIKSIKFYLYSPSSQICLRGQQMSANFPKNNPLTVKKWKKPHEKQQRRDPPPRTDMQLMPCVQDRPP